MVRVEVKFIGSDRIGRYIATGKIGIGISVKWRIGATLPNGVVLTALKATAPVRATGMKLK